MKRQLCSMLYIAVIALLTGSVISAGSGQLKCKAEVIQQNQAPQLTAGVSSKIGSLLSGEKEPAYLNNFAGTGCEDIQIEEMQMHPEFTYDRDWDEKDSYLLARIAMAEAEGENTQSKTLVIMTVLNRVQSNTFPDNIRDVIFQFDMDTGVYQFSCIGNGRWDKVEPNKDCWEAVEVVRMAGYDYSGGALYFETCDDEDNWHSRNLEYLFQCGQMRFYR